MIITTAMWDKQSEINGCGAARLIEKFTGENGNIDRVLVYYDGVISRIQYVDDNEFSVEEKLYMNDLIQSGADNKRAIVETWQYKIINEHEKAKQEELTAEEAKAREMREKEQIRADIDYLLIMGGFE